MFNYKDNINKSITEKINALDPNNQNQDLNAQFEIHENENFENYITRIGENLKYLIKNQKGSRSMQNFLDKILLFFYKFDLIKLY